MTVETLKNKLGAFALAISDRVLDAVEHSGPLGTTACSALVATCHLPENPTIGDLAKICNVSHSVMVRTVEQLVEHKFLARETGIDRRSVRLKPTKTGLAYRDKILSKRASALESAVKTLSADEQTQLNGLLARMLTGITTSRLESEKICRLCDFGVCKSDCPPEVAALHFEQLHADNASLQ
jgi:DNA-binding MarR family transcriptional regulator